MSKRKLYGYPKCSTCKKAQAYLGKLGLGYEAIDITLQPPTMSELKGMLKVYSGNIKKLLNTSGQVYREMKLTEKLPNMSDQQVLDLLANQGKLIKRPFLVEDGKAALVGFREEEWKSLLRK